MCTLFFEQKLRFDQKQALLLPSLDYVELSSSYVTLFKYGAEGETGVDNISHCFNKIILFYIKYIYQIVYHMGIVWIFTSCQL